MSRRRPPATTPAAPPALSPGSAGAADPPPPEVDPALAAADRPVDDPVPDPAGDQGTVQDVAGDAGGDAGGNTARHADRDARLEPGRLVGRYRLVRPLGHGAFATVWLGHDDDLAVPVAVKVLDERWLDNTDVRQRFVTEARLMRRIRDERVTHVYDIGHLRDDRPYFVMDFADGGSLADLEPGPQPPVRALRLAAEACRAIGALHDHDVVHRDVTPGNLLLGRGAPGRQQVLVADLGVAKDLAAVVGLPAAAGTPAFMAPEQARGEHLDHRADLYAVAAVCYLLVSGRPPFRARSIDDVIGRDPEARPDPLADRFGTPAMLDVLLGAGLAADPNRRPPTAGLFADALDRIADELEPERADVEDGSADETGQTGPTVERPEVLETGSGTAADDDQDAGDSPAPGRSRTRPPPAEDEPAHWRGQATMIRPVARPSAVEVIPAPGVGSSEAGVAAASRSSAGDPGDVAADDVRTVEPVLPRPLAVYLLWLVLGLALFSGVLLGLAALLR